MQLSPALQSPFFFPFGVRLCLEKKEEKKKDKKETKEEERREEKREGKKEGKKEKKERRQEKRENKTRGAQCTFFLPMQTPFCLDPWTNRPTFV